MNLWIIYEMNFIDLKGQKINRFIINYLFKELRWISFTSSTSSHSSWELSRSSSRRHQSQRNLCKALVLKTFNGAINSKLTVKKLGELDNMLMPSWYINLSHRVFIMINHNTRIDFAIYHYTFSSPFHSMLKINTNLFKLIIF